jgi:hypothetical protein
MSESDLTTLQERVKRIEEKLASRVIEGRTLSLSYTNGKPMIVMAESESGNVGLLIFDRSGAARVELHLTPEDRPRFALKHDNGQAGVGFAITGEAEPYGLGMDCDGDALWTLAPEDNEEGPDPEKVARRFEVIQGGKAGKR